MEFAIKIVYSGTALDEWCQIFDPKSINMKCLHVQFSQFFLLKLQLKSLFPLL